MARRKAGAPISARAARRAKVDVAFVPRPPVWPPDWELIEKAWNRNVLPAARNEIAQAFAVYLRDESLVRAAPFKDDVRKKLDHLRKAAEAFANALAAFTHGPGAEEAGARLRPLLPVAVEDQKLHLDEMAREADSVALVSALAIDELDGKLLPERTPELDLDAVVATALALLPTSARNDPDAVNAAIDRALSEARRKSVPYGAEDIDDDPIDDHFDVVCESPKEWAAWDQLMVDLCEIAERHGLYEFINCGVVGVDVGDEKDLVEPEGGAFVAAINAMASTLPPGFARPHKDLTAFAQAILKARRQDRR
jgi:hypothetical protein